MMLQAIGLALRARNKFFTWMAARQLAACGKHTTIEWPARLGGLHRVRIGSGAFIGADSWIEVMPFGAAARDAVAITLGDRVSLSGHCTITAVESVTIEDDVMIARYVYISDHSHAYDDPQRPIKDQGISKVAPVHIGRGAWLGQGVVICPGVTVGRNSVVGANSVVRQDVPPFCVAAGSPAQVIKRLVPPA